ncbi:hypothetical protein GCM10023196_053450 [Actinoallomurus vinaceus]|uniref:Thioesterase domain-containing protein n=1 Tax=Actinoallomurus vinaceus TaxID=1080074 RepID=A0ABP8UGJ7_9ACTN
MIEGDLPPSDDMVAHVWRTSESTWTAPATLIPLIPEGRREPLFCVHLGNGHVRFFGRIAESLRAGRPVHGFEAIGYRTRVRPPVSIAEIAERYVRELRAAQPHGPYHLAGLCTGAVIAYEMAQRLRAQGAEVAVLALADPPSGMPEYDPSWGMNDLYEFRLGWLRTTWGLEDPVADLPRVLDEMKTRVTLYEPEVRPEDFYRLQVLWAATVFAQEHYEPRPYDGPVHIFAKTRDDYRVRDYWLPLLRDPALCLIDAETTRELLHHPLLARTLGRALGHEA